MGLLLHFRRTQAFIDEIGLGMKRFLPLVI